jgi:hypothetical protein
MSRRSPNRIVRRDLLFFLIALAIVQMCLSIAVEHWLPDVRDPEYALKEERLRTLRAEKPDHRLLVMLGSSRGSMGFQAEQLSRTLGSSGIVTFNAALSGGGPVLELICLRRLLSAGLRPDFVLIEVVPLHFNQPDDLALEERILNGARLRRSELSAIRVYGDDPSRHDRQWWKNRLFPAFTQNAELRDHLGIDPPQPGVVSDDPHRFLDAYGWYPRYHVPDPPRQCIAAANALAQYAPFTQTYRPAAKSLRALNDLLTACRNEGIRAALVVMPEASSFRSLYSTEVQTGVDRLLQNVSRDWLVPLIDARNWVADADFWDGHHLLPTGAASFTQRLGCELMGYLPAVGSRHAVCVENRVTLPRSSP